MPICRMDSTLECIYPTFFIRGSKDTPSACLKCPIFCNRGQSIFNTEGGVKTITLEEELAQRVKETGDFMSISDIPDEIELLLVNHVFKTDSRGNDALFVYFRTAQDQRVVQKYTQTSYEDILKAFKKAGGVDHLKVVLTKYTKGILGSMQKPRLIPVPLPRKPRAPAAAKD